LTQDAARETFMDITDSVHNIEDVDKVLLLADNMPLAVNLIAHLVDSEGISGVLNRWDVERTSILSEGYNPRTNLELSISMSISGSRITSAPHALDLLSLLSMLPDGLSNVELLQSSLPLDNILGCKSTLLRTALAYIDDQKRLKTLAPIREYMQKQHPPSNELIRPLFKHFRELLQLHSTYSGTLSSAPIVQRITSNFSNIQNILLEGLNHNNPDLRETIYSICDLDVYCFLTGRGQIHFLNRVPDVLSQLDDQELEVYFLMRVLTGQNKHPIPDAVQRIEQAVQHLANFDDADLKCKFTALLYLS
jgi:hypothetical protein